MNDGFYFSFKQLQDAEIVKGEPWQDEIIESERRVQKQCLIRLFYQEREKEWEEQETRRSPVRRVSVRRRELLKESGCSVESIGGVRRKWGFIG